MEAGVPGPGAEISEAYTPLEAGLAHLVADNKGCYTGQEVLARQTTYDKVTRRLAGIKLKALVAPGAEVLAAGKPAGVITSAGSSPRFGPVALAILRRPHHEPGTSVEIGGIHGQVISLPFSPQP
jgi:folate-binding protein YgfZ